MVRIELNRQIRILHLLPPTRPWTHLALESYKQFASDWKINIKQKQLFIFSVNFIVLFRQRHH